LSNIALSKGIKIFDLVTGYTKSKHDTTINAEKNIDNNDENSNNETRYYYFFL